MLVITERYAGAVSGAGNGLWITNYGHDLYQSDSACPRSVTAESRRASSRFTGCCEHTLDGAESPAIGTL